MTAQAPHDTPPYLGRLPRIGQMIRRARQRHGMTQAHVAQWAGIGTRALNELERGKRDHLALASFLRVLDVVGLDLAIMERP